MHGSRLSFNRVILLLGARLPSIIQAPTSVHTFETGSFTLHCQADHHAEVLLWEKDGYAIDTESSRFTIRGGGRTSSSLTVMNAGKENSGVYYCVAESEAGRVNTSAVAVVTGTVLTCDGEFVRHR